MSDQSSATMAYDWFGAQLQTVQTRIHCSRGVIKISRKSYFQGRENVLNLSYFIFEIFSFLMVKV